jgi:hypothetical protein
VREGGPDSERAGLPGDFLGLVAIPDEWFGVGDLETGDPTRNGALRAYADDIGQASTHVAAINKGRMGFLDNAATGGAHTMPRINPSAVSILLTIVG